VLLSGVHAMDEIWIQLDPSSLRNTLLHKRVDTTAWGSEGTLPSPYDVPEAIRITRDADQNIHVIRFFYIGEDEPAEEKSLLDDVRIRLGKHSGRIQEIELYRDQNELAHSGIRTKLRDSIGQLTAVLDRLIDSVKSDGVDRAARRALANYVLAKDAVAENRDMIAAN
ncbi:MAG: hypothetical protein AAFR09_07225, partial [Pseudomonadota bacterium]